MIDYYIYILKLVNDSQPDEARYYVGKTYLLKERMRNHFNMNRKSTSKIGANDYVVDSLERLIQIDGIENLSPNSDSVTSIIENIVTECVMGKFECSQVRGGHFLEAWDATFKAPKMNPDNLDYEDLTSFSFYSATSEGGVIKSFKNKKWESIRLVEDNDVSKKQDDINRVFSQLRVLRDQEKKNNKDYKEKESVHKLSINMFDTL